MSQYDYKRTIPKPSRMFWVGDLTVLKQRILLCLVEVTTSFRENVILGLQCMTCNHLYTGLLPNPINGALAGRNQDQVHPGSFRQELGKLTPRTARLLTCAREVVEECHRVIGAKFFSEQSRLVY